MLKNTFTRIENAPGEVIKMNISNALTPDQEANLLRLKMCYPFRVCYAIVYKDGHVENRAVTTKSGIIKHIKKGRMVYVAE